MRSPERIEFLSDLVTTVVESGSYLSWWRFRNYSHHIHCVIASDFSQIAVPVADLYYDDPIKGDDGDHSGGPIKLDIDLIAKGLGVIEREKLNLHSSIKARILQASRENDAGMLDIDDADVIVQAAVFKEIVYG